jgi:hypothetical protein
VMRLILVPAPQHMLLPGNYVRIFSLSPAVTIGFNCCEEMTGLKSTLEENIYYILIIYIFVCIVDFTKAWDFFPLLPYIWKYDIPYPGLFNLFVLD